MERQKRADERKILLDKSLKTLLFFWQANPDSPEMAARLGDAIERGALEGRGLQIKIKEETFFTREGRNSISRSDLSRYAKLIDENYVFRFMPKKGPEGKIRVSVKNPSIEEGKGGILDKFNLVLEGKGDDGWRTLAIFRAQEIYSVSVL
jgi:hypothetical protein